MTPASGQPGGVPCRAWLGWWHWGRTWARRAFRIGRRPPPAIAPVRGQPRPRVPPARASAAAPGLRPGPRQPHSCNRRREDNPVSCAEGRRQKCAREDGRGTHLPLAGWFHRALDTGQGRTLTFMEHRAERCRWCPQRSLKSFSYFLCLAILPY